MSETSDESIKIHPISEEEFHERALLDDIGRAWDRASRKPRHHFKGFFHQTWVLRERKGDEDKIYVTIDNHKGVLTADIFGPDIKRIPFFGKLELLDGLRLWFLDNPIETEESQ